MAKIGLLIGVDEYEPGLNPLPAAGKDIEALRRVLQDPEMGDFHELKSLKNPDPQIMQYEIEALFSERTKEDLILLYFSGHGIKDDAGNLYFATRATKKNSKGELVRSTAVPASFIHEVMKRSRAKRQVIILDCCFSGAFDPILFAKNDNSIDLQGQLGSEGRVVLASSSCTEYSFEQEGAELSVYTRYLIEGIETGAGDLNRDGQISILELHEYASCKIQEFLPNLNPKIIVMRDKGFEIILAKAKCHPPHVLGTTHSKIKIGEIKLEYSSKLNNDRYYNPIPSLLQPFESFISRLITKLDEFSERLLSKYKEETPVIQNFILEIIRLTSDADLVFVMSRANHQNVWDIKAQSHFSEVIDDDDYAEIIKNKILANLPINSIFTSDHHGIFRIHYDEQASVSKAFILIPLDTLDNEFILVCGLLRDSYLLSDAYCTIISSFYLSSQKFYLQSARVEASILDNLKKVYGFVPISFYEKRFSLFCDRLAKIIIYFEPILDLDTFSISGWEALARDPDSLTAPVDLFYAAELWGRKFTIELDKFLLRLAADSYRKALIEAKQNRAYEILPLSVNVYPESLMRTAYFETVREIVKEGKSNQIPARKLILEISEKADLPMYQDGVKLLSPLDTFKLRLSKYVQELKIKFGIDDFGVGYASVSRLAGLNPPYVKIDREILHREPVSVIINFVQQIVSSTNPLNPASIIVEGLDKTSPVKLCQLRKLDISYVQGHLIGKAEPGIYRLSQEKSEFLREQIFAE
ncbi:MULTISPECIES: caspase, EACC1-associated type [Nostocales]|uniref:caspase, EACC1-associated type n=1 Tax=Nostocales TaxID=1161 RepID=UPI001F5500D4|nr:MULTISPECIES: EAL domain-containing protein [Nostocales]